MNSEVKSTMESSDPPTWKAALAVEPEQQPMNRHQTRAYAAVMRRAQRAQRKKVVANLRRFEEFLGSTEAQRKALGVLRKIMPHTPDHLIVQQVGNLPPKAIRKLADTILAAIAEESKLPTYDPASLKVYIDGEPLPIDATNVEYSEVAE